MICIVTSSSSFCGLAFSCAPAAGEISRSNAQNVVAMALMIAGRCEARKPLSPECFMILKRLNC
jgi:hypothetical protein